MAEQKTTGGAIIPAGSQLDDPVAAGQAATKNDQGQVDPFNNPNWLAGDDEFKPQTNLDADPNTPGVDVFGGNINDLPQEITIPADVQAPADVQTPAPEAATPAPVVPLAQAPMQPEVLPAAPVAEPVASAVPEPMTVAPEQLVAAATTEEPKAKALNKLIDQVIAPKTRRNVFLAIIFVLLVLVFLLASATVYLMLRGPVNVTISTGRTNSSQSSSQTSSTAQSTSSSESTSSAAASTHSIYGFMVLLNSDNPDSEVTLDDLPEGSLKLTEGYLVRVLLAQAVSTNDPVKEALTRLLAIKENTYGDEGYHNYLSRAQLMVTTKEGTDSNSELEVNLTGQFDVAQPSDINLAKQQIERTIENYTLNYKVLLNGKESDYNCLESSDTNCR